jgi:prolipoprotein diacylglyceryltransferase
MSLIGPDATMSHPVIPTQNIHMIFAFCAFVLLLIIFRNRKRDGQVMLALGFIYPVLRILVEFCRADNHAVMFALTISQAISFIVIAVCVVLFIWVSLLPAKEETTPAAAGIPRDGPKDGAKKPGAGKVKKKKNK